MLYLTSLLSYFILFFSREEFRVLELCVCDKNVLMVRFKQTRFFFTFLAKL